VRHKTVIFEHDWPAHSPHPNWKWAWHEIPSRSVAGWCENHHTKVEVCSCYTFQVISILKWKMRDMVPFLISCHIHVLPSEVSLYRYVLFILQYSTCKMCCPWVLYCTHKHTYSHTHVHTHTHTYNIQTHARESIQNLINCRDSWYILTQNNSCAKTNPGGKDITSAFCLSIDCHCLIWLQLAVCIP